MEDTQKYLNGILEKRLGSVINSNSISKKANTVTRLPKKQQNLQSMPTVFRKKQQTIYKQPLPKQFISQYKSQLKPQIKQSTQSQRVQYGLISKRITNMNDCQIKPAVDISKYKNQYHQQIDNQQRRDSQYKQKGQFYGNQSISKKLDIPNDNQFSVKSQHSIQGDVNIQTNTKRKKIFDN